MKKGRYFSYKEKSHITYNYLKNRKITAISEGVSKDNNSWRKD